MPWLAEEMLNEQHQRVDISAHARTAHKGLLQKAGRGSLLNHPPKWLRDRTENTHTHTHTHTRTHANAHMHIERKTERQ